VHATVKDLAAACSAPADHLQLWHATVVLSAIVLNNIVRTLELLIFNRVVFVPQPRYRCIGYLQTGLRSRPPMTAEAFRRGHQWHTQVTTVSWQRSSLDALRQ
jgi:hypothetical protein